MDSCTMYFYVMTSVVLSSRIRQIQQKKNLFSYLNEPSFPISLSPPTKDVNS